MIGIRGGICCRSIWGVGFSLIYSGDMGKSSIILLVFVCAVLSCVQSKSQDTVIDKSSIVYDTSNIAILSFAEYQSPYEAEPKAVKGFMLSQVNMTVVDSLLKHAAGNWNNMLTPASREAFEVDLTNYQRQYIPFINAYGEKLVYINLFCRHQWAKWKTELLIVDDGGKCFAHVLINLTQKNYAHFATNGDV
jgi:hypothetical protein